MARVVIDTNVLVSAVTDRNAEQRARAETLFRAAAAAETSILLPQVVIFELAFVLLNVYDLERTIVHELLAALVKTPGVDVQKDIDIEELLAHWPATFPQIVDAAVAVVALETSSRVATFDRQFAARLRRLGVSLADL